MKEGRVSCRWGARGGAGVIIDRVTAGQTLTKYRDEARRGFAAKANLEWGFTQYSVCGKTHVIHASRTITSTHPGVS